LLGWIDENISSKRWSVCLFVRGVLLGFFRLTEKNSFYASQAVIKWPLLYSMLVVWLQILFLLFLSSIGHIIDVRNCFLSWLSSIFHFAKKKTTKLCFVVSMSKRRFSTCILKFFCYLFIYLHISVVIVDDCDFWQWDCGNTFLIIASLLTFLVDVVALTLTDIAFMSAFVDDTPELLSLKRLRTNLIVWNVVACIIFAFWIFTAPLSIYFVSARARHIPSAVVMPLTCCFIAVIFGGGGLSMLFLGALFGYYDADGTVPAMSACGVLVWVGALYLPIYFLDRVVCQLMAESIGGGGSSSGAVSGASVGRIIQPGIAAGQQRAACPSCATQLEYQKAPSGPTQVQCYKCQAIVEFD
jgi:LSD1 subclass zinc finger protein